MTLRNLEIFAAVCEKMSMSRAAEELFISQSAVSHAIKALETEFGTLLFQRRSGKLFLTEAGERMQQNIKCVLDYLGNLQSAIKSGDEPRPTVRLGCTPSLGEYFIHELLAEYQREIDAADIFVGSYQLGLVETFLMEHELDLALIDGGTNAGFLDAVPLFQDTMTYLCRRDSRHMTLPETAPGEIPTVDARSMTGVPIYTQRWDPNTLRLPERLHPTSGLLVRDAGSFNSFREVENAVRLDLGVGVLPSMAIDPEGELLPFRVSGMSFRREINLIMCDSRYASPALLDFIDFIYTYVRRHVPAADLLI